MGAMYGDLVNAVTYSVCLPCYLWLSAKHPSPAAWTVILTFLWTVVFSSWSYWTGIPTISAVAVLGMMASSACMNLYEWPHPGQLVVQPQFLWMLIIISGNTRLGLSHKATLGLLGLCMAIAIHMISPMGQLLDSLPLLLCGTVVFLLYHYYGTSRSYSSLMTAHGSALVLAGSFAYYVSKEIAKICTQPGYGLDGGYGILKAGFFALVGLYAAGTFRHEIDMNKLLERIVKERTEKIMKQAERLFMLEHALKASATAIAICDADHNIIWCNAALGHLTGYSAQGQLQTKCLIKALGATNLDRDRIFTVPLGGATNQEIHIRDRSLKIQTSSFPAATSPTDGRGICSSSRDDTNTTGTSWNRFLVAVHDVTAERARERAEMAAEREALAAQAMEESMQTLSHELRTPLQGIMGITSLMLGDPTLVRDVRESMSLVMSSAQLLLTLINNLLDIRKMDASMLNEFALEPTNLMTSIQKAADYCKPFAAITNVRLCIESSDISRRVVSNDLRLQQVLINLISNAIKYTGPNSAVVRIWVDVMSLAEADEIASRALVSGSLHREKKGWTGDLEMEVAVVSVADEGHGLSEQAAPKIFEMFNHDESSSSPIDFGGTGAGQPSGTGLGLNLCLKFVERMKGSIWACNNPEKGCTFSFFIPLSSRDIIRPAAAVTSQLTSASKSASRDPLVKASSDGLVPPVASHYRVLVVDDIVMNLKVAARMLKSVGAAKVETALSGQEALDILVREDYNLVLTDLQMPGMSGCELSRAIRDSATLYPKPIVVGFTAGASEQVEASCRSSGMACVLYKPITADQLMDFFEAVPRRFNRRWSMSASDKRSSDALDDRDTTADVHSRSLSRTRDRYHCIRRTRTGLTQASSSEGKQIGVQPFASTLTGNSLSVEP